MSLEAAFKQLAIRPASICRQCRRSFASSTSRRQQPQSATADLFRASQPSQDATTSRPPPPSPQRTATLSSSPSTAAPEPKHPSGALGLARSVIANTVEAQRRRDEEQRRVRVERDWDRSDLERQATRKWRAGDVYAPHDLTGVEHAKWKKLRRQRKQKYDAVDQLGINPIHHYKNFSIMSEYISDMGRIKSRVETGLRPVNQRRMAKAIRRAVGTGLMPAVYRHPEILKIEMRQKRPGGM